MLKRILMRTNLVTMQLLIAMLGGSTIIVITFFSLYVIDAKFQENSTQTAAALDVTEMQQGIDSIFILGLSAKLDGAAAGDINNPVVTVPRAIQGHDTMQQIVLNARALDTLVHTPESGAILDRVLALEKELNAWLIAPTNEGLTTLSQDFSCASGTHAKRDLVLSDERSGA